MNNFWKVFVEGIISIFSVKLFTTPKSKQYAELDIYRRVYNDINNALEKFSNDQHKRS
jgi:hypothetical protein